MLNRLPTVEVRRSLFVAVGLSMAFSVVACSGESAEPTERVDRSSTVPASGAHLLEPNDEMRRLATQQCLDDPDLARGEVRAVDPADPDQVLAVVTVDCAEAR